MPSVTRFLFAMLIAKEFVATLAENGHKALEKRSIPNFVGIPVPGQTVSGLDIFNLYLHSCKPEAAQSELYSPATKLLSNENGEQLAKQIYANLFYNAGGVEADKLAGRWFRVVDSPTVHNEACAVTYMNILQQSTYTATFLTKDYFRSNDSENEKAQMTTGYAVKYGPDSGEFLWHTNKPADLCPYLLVKTGPLNEKFNQYEYLIFSQFLKFPVIILARDYENFGQNFREEVKKFLEMYNFLNRVTVANNMVRFMDFSTCAEQYYFHTDQ